VARLPQQRQRDLAKLLDVREAVEEIPDRSVEQVFLKAERLAGCHALDEGRHSRRPRVPRVAREMPASPHRVGVGLRFPQIDDRLRVENSSAQPYCSSSTRDARKNKKEREGKWQEGSEKQKYGKQAIALSAPEIARKRSRAPGTSPRFNGRVVIHLIYSAVLFCVTEADISFAFQYWVQSF
jgi:hypothetical protein